MKEDAAGKAQLGVTDEEAEAAEVDAEQPEVQEAPAPEAAGRVLFNASHCDYDVVTGAAKARGWKLTRAKGKVAQANVHWIDDGTVREWMPKIEPWMRVNHFPGVFEEMGRKSCLARNMARIQRAFPAEYRFLPATWTVPQEVSELERHFATTAGQRAVYIVKPDTQCQGRGIFLTTELGRIKAAAAESKEPLVIQQYIARPMLIDGLKFDLRLYFLVCALLTPDGLFESRCFLFKNGLVRLCTAPYAAPTPETLDQRCMHLTNYAVNKKSKDFEANVDADDDGSGSKRSLQWFMGYVEEEHGEEERKRLWSKLSALCVKTFVAVQPALEAAYANTYPKDISGGRMGCRCFQILGIDAMIDHKRKPWLIEVNHLPSFNTDSPLDEDIKGRLVEQTLHLACPLVTAADRQECEAHACDRRGNEAAQGSSLELGAMGRASAESLNVSSYGDFERVLPVPETSPRLAGQCEAILARARENVRALFSGRRPPRPRPTSSTSRPAAGPAPPGSAACPGVPAPGAPPRPPSAGQQAAEGAAAAGSLSARSRAASGPPRCGAAVVARRDGQLLLRRRTSSPLQSLGEHNQKEPVVGTPSRAGRPKSVPRPRECLPLSRVQIGL
mmetsp:Transcript_85514/g.191146  ORF Transcript_85514/g.191146 Transcript_85514/m.191146 type:complete len:616 (+) Transcript_85514:123-1970(+)